MDNGPPAPPAAETYNGLFAELTDHHSEARPGAAPGIILYVVRTAKGRLQTFSRSENGTALPIHSAPAAGIVHLGYRKGDTRDRTTGKQILSLPIFPQIRQEQVRVAKVAAVRASEGADLGPTFAGRLIIEIPGRAGERHSRDRNSQAGLWDPPQNLDRSRQLASRAFFRSNYRRIETARL